jgi:RNA polymerase sigma-70 factor, ECF subfamily
MHPWTADQNALGEEWTDEVLASRAPGDFDAFAELYRRYLHRIYRFVRSQVSNRTVAEDLTAQVFFKALSSAATFKGHGSYRSWLFRIAHNTVATHRARSEPAVVVEEVPDEMDPSPSPASQAIASEARGVVWRKVAQLPDAQREVVSLHYGEGLSIEEISNVLKKTRGAVRILLHKGRNKLRDALSGRDLL